MFLVLTYRRYTAPDHACHPPKSLLFGRGPPHSAINLSPCFSTKHECGKQDVTLTNVPVSDPYLSANHLQSVADCCKAVLSLIELTQRGRSAPALPRMLPTMTYGIPTQRLRVNLFRQIECKKVKFDISLLHVFLKLATCRTRLSVQRRTDVQKGSKTGSKIHSI